MKSPLAILVLLVALAAPVVVFLWLASRPGANGWVAAGIAVAAGWALNVAWASVVGKNESGAEAGEKGNTLAIAARFGWICPAVLVVVSWLVAPASAQPLKPAPVRAGDVQALVGPRFDALFDQADGASCSAATALRAIDEAALLGAFVESACHQEIQR